MCPRLRELAAGSRNFPQAFLCDSVEEDLRRSCCDAYWFNDYGSERPLKERAQNDTKHLASPSRQQWAQQVFVKRISVCRALDIRSRNRPRPTTTCLLTKKSFAETHLGEKLFVKTDADSSFLLFSPLRSMCALCSFRLDRSCEKPRGATFWTFLPLMAGQYPTGLPRAMYSFSTKNEE